MVRRAGSSRHVDRLPEVPGRGHGVGVRLGQAELAEDLGAIRRVGRFVEGAAQIGDRGLRSTLREGPLGGAAERRDDESIAHRDRPHEVRRGLLGRSAASEQQLGRAAMSTSALVGAHVLEDRGPDDRVGELERVLVAQEIGSDKGAGRRHGRR